VLYLKREETNLKIEENKEKKRKDISEITAKQILLIYF